MTPKQTPSRLWEAQNMWSWVALPFIGPSYFWVGARKDLVQLFYPEKASVSRQLIADDLETSCKQIKDRKIIGG